MQIAMETITPQEARLYLANQVDNRKVREARVRQWADDMKRGEFPAIAQPIMFAIDGRLMDGQHRLHAIVKAEMPVELLVARGVPLEHRRYIDGGAPRTAADVLQMDHGVVNHQAVTATATLVLLYEVARDRTWRGAAAYRPSKQAIVNEVLGHDDEYQVAARQGKVATRSTASGIWLTRSSYGALSVLVGRQSEWKHLWPEFHEGVSTGANLGVADARLALRSASVPAGRHKEGQWSLLACLRAWNAFVDGKDLQIVRTGHVRYLPMPEVK